MKDYLLVLIIAISFSGCNKRQKEIGLFSLPDNLSNTELIKEGYVNNIDYPYYRKRFGDTSIIYENNPKGDFRNKVIFISLKNGLDSLYIFDFFTRNNCSIVSNLNRKENSLDFFVLNCKENYYMEVTTNSKVMVIKIPIPRQL